MIYAASPTLDGPAVRRARRGPLPAGPVPGRGVGGGHHPPRRPRSTWCACRRRCRTPRSSPTGSRRCGARPTAVIEERRPVALDHLYLVGDRGARPAPPAPDVRRRRRAGELRPNPEAARLDARAPARARAAGPAADAAAARPGASRSSSCLADERHAAGDLLHLQPGRLRPGGRAVPGRRASGSPTPEERREIRAHRRGRTPTRSPTTTSPCSATARGSPASRPGFAAHHAGMVPPMKEAVEEAFAAGPGEGRVRHRDAVARHQHAGPLGRASRSSRSSPASATSS